MGKQKKKTAKAIASMTGFARSSGSVENVILRVKPFDHSGENAVIALIDQLSGFIDVLSSTEPLDVFI